MPIYMSFDVSWNEENSRSAPRFKHQRNEESIEIHKNVKEKCTHTHTRIKYVDNRVMLQATNNFHFYDAFSSSYCHWFYTELADSSRYFLKPHSKVSTSLFLCLRKYFENIETGINCCQWTTIDNFTSASPFSNCVKMLISYLTLKRI